MIICLQYIHNIKDYMIIHIKHIMVFHFKYKVINTSYNTYKIKNHI
jgi:hypothetical protein